MSDIRVTKSQFERLIVEYNKHQKNVIKENDQEIEEGWLKDDPISEEEAIQKILSHRLRGQYYKEWLDTNPERAKALVDFVMKNPQTKQIKWDPQKKQFVDPTIYSAKTMGGGKSKSWGG